MGFGTFLMGRPEELEDSWDVIVVGAGPGGLTAAIYLARFGLKTLVLDKGTPGGKASLNPMIENYPGFLGIDGSDLARRFHEHAVKAGAKVAFPEEVIELDLAGEPKRVRTASGRTLEARAVIIATGSEDRKLGVPGEDRLYGKGVSYCAVCDGPLFKGKRVAVVGGGDTAAISTIYLSSLATEVILIHRRDRMRAEKVYADRVLGLPNVRFRWNSVVEEIMGDGKVEAVRIRNLQTGEETIERVDAVFIFIGVIPNSELAKVAGVEVDEKGFIKVDYWCQTNMRGVYAVGDVTGEPMQIAKAVGDGVKAAIHIHDKLFGGAYGQ